MVHPKCFFSFLFIIFPYVISMLSEITREWLMISIINSSYLITCNYKRGFNGGCVDRDPCFGVEEE